MNDVLWVGSQPWVGTDLWDAPHGGSSAEATAAGLVSVVGLAFGFGFFGGSMRPRVLAGSTMSGRSRLADEEV